MYLLTTLWMSLLILPVTFSAFRPARLSPPADEPPAVVHGSLDCGEGYHTQAVINGMVPNGWEAIVKNQGTPYLTSTQMWGRGGSCDPNEPWWKWEKIEGHDSFLFMGGCAPLGQDFPSPPCDATLYQRVRVTPGAVYSVSAWMMSLCGGSAMPNDCPAGQYIAKMVGVDPTGGVDPRAASVAWLEDRRPHYETRWLNFSPTVQAKTDAVTLFLRARSPFTHHGNHVYTDGVMMVRSPTAAFTEVRAGDGTISLRWTGDLKEDIPAIEAGNYRAYFSVEYQTRPDGPWGSWLTRVPEQGAVLAVSKCRDSTYRFRVRVTAEQPAGEPGAWPPHRFEGPWQMSQRVTIGKTVDCPFRAWQPLVLR